MVFVRPESGPLNLREGMWVMVRKGTLFVVERKSATTIFAGDPS